MVDRGLFLTMQAVRRQLAAMPHDLYLVRLIHSHTRRAFPGERLWTAAQLLQPATLRFLRVRNREGCDIYLQPYAGQRNAGYLLVDLDHAPESVLEDMRANGHEPCVVLQTSPGHLQAWIRVSSTPLEPAVASAIGRHLAHAYRGDLASSDWRHLGRLAGFTNQKPQRRQPNGYAPWVRLLYTWAGLATHSASLLEPTKCQATRGTGTCAPLAWDLVASCPANASQIYQAWLHRLRILPRFPQPDWSIADKWIAKELLRQGTPTAAIAAILERGSPGFPRRHADPQDYLRRTIARAFQEIAGAGFPVPRTRCVDPMRCRQPARHTA